MKKNNNNFLLSIAILAIGILLALLYNANQKSRQNSNNSLLISNKLLKLSEINEKIKLTSYKVESFRQFALKEPEQQKLKELQLQLNNEKESLLEILQNNTTLHNSLVGQSDTLTRVVNQLEPPINILTSLSPSDFNWKEKQNLSTQELNKLLPQTSAFILNFQTSITLHNEEFEKNNSILVISIMAALFLIILTISVTIYLPQSKKLKQLLHQKDELSTLSTASNKKVSELNALVLNLEEKIIEEKSQNTIINKSLEEKNKEITRFKEDSEYFTYIISHDLKAPLRAISSLSSWIHEDMQDKLEDEQKKYLDILRSRVQRMDDLINGILNFAMAGKKANKKEKIYLNQLISEIILELEGTNNVKFNIQSDLPLMLTDKGALQIVLNHLFSNAVKFNNSTNPTVSFLCEQKVDFYEFKVIDNGIGIDPTYHSQIFEIFKTLDDTKDSSGVGLSIAKKIIQDIGGDIWVKSSPEKGSTFFFTWPA